MAVLDPMPPLPGSDGIGSSTVLCGSTKEILSHKHKTYGQLSTVIVKKARVGEAYFPFPG
jgi:hypothetical protein